MHISHPRAKWLALAVLALLIGGALGAGLAPKGALANHFTNSTKDCTAGTPTFTCDFDIHLGADGFDTLSAGAVVTVDLVATNANFVSADVTGGTCDADVTAQTATHLDITTNAFCAVGSNIVVTETLLPVGLGGGSVCQQPDTFGNTPILDICDDDFAVPSKLVDALVPALGHCAQLQDGAEASGYQVNDDPDPYKYFMPDPVPATAGDAPDHRWVQDTGPGGPLSYDLGTARPAVILFPSIDHGPIPQEGLEATVYGSSDGIAMTEAGVLTTVYGQGFDPAWISDDYASLWTFSQPYQYFLVGHGGPGALLSDGDAEIDALCEVEPPHAQCQETTNPAGVNVPKSGVNAGKSGQNPDGFYVLTAEDGGAPIASIVVADNGSTFVSGPFASGDQVKITQAPGVTPSDTRPGPGVIVSHLKLKGDALLRVTDTLGNVTEVTCLVPPPPK